MSSSPNQIVQKLWNYCNVLRDDGMSYGDYVEQLTFSPGRLSIIEELETAVVANLTWADCLRQAILISLFRAQPRNAL